MIGGVGCLLVLVLACGGAVFFVYRGVSSFGFASATPPADFPVYPGARQQSALSVKPSGVSAPITTVQWATTDSSDQVIGFYRTNLDRPPWHLLDEQHISIAEQFSIENTARSEYGLVRVQTILQQTTIQLTIGSRSAIGVFPTPSD